MNLQCEKNKYDFKGQKAIVKDQNYHDFDRILTSFNFRHYIQERDSVES